MTPTVVTEQNECRVDFSRILRGGTSSQNSVLLCDVYCRLFEHLSYMDTHAAVLLHFAAMMRTNPSSVEVSAKIFFDLSPIWRHVCPVFPNLKSVFFFFFFFSYSLKQNILLHTFSRVCKLLFSVYTGLCGNWHLSLGDNFLAFYSNRNPHTAEEFPGPRILSDKQCRN
jgi:hypothetical protein